MSKLVCDFGSFSEKTSSIKNKITEYEAILTQVEGLETNTEYMWKSDSQKVYYNKFMERKRELEELRNTYNEMVEFLNEVTRTYQEIESKYS